MQLPGSGKCLGLWAFLFVSFFNGQCTAFPSTSRAKDLRIKRNRGLEDPIKSDDPTMKQELSDAKLFLSDTHMHTQSPICLVPITHLHGARRMAGFWAVRISCSTRASCSLILYCYFMNSGGPKQQETGTHVTALTLWPRYQPPCLLVCCCFFFLCVCVCAVVAVVRLQSLPRTLIHYHRTVLSIWLTHDQENKAFTGHPGFPWINLQQSSTN